ncbi:MAG: glycosyltransferase family 4 protein, partial [Colwellia sp.]
KFDGVVYYSPSIFFGYLASKIKKACQCHAYLILRDMFPQWAIDEGLIKHGSLIEKYFRFFERLNYSSADCIGLMSPKNLRLFENINGSKYNTEVLYNWADKDALPCKSKVFGVREQFNLADKVIYFYGGNIGHAQDMGNLLRLAEAMKQIKNAHFIFLGQGDEVTLVKQTIEDKALLNCSFIPSVSQEEYKLLLNEIDVGLFSLSAKHTAHNFPGKLLGYMVHSLPILGSVNKGNDLIDIIQDANAGFIFNNGDDEGFYKSAKELAMNVELRENKGLNANQLLVAQFSVESAASQILISFTKRD